MRTLGATSALGVLCAIVVGISLVACNRESALDSQVENVEDMEGSDVSQELRSLIEAIDSGRLDNLRIQLESGAEPTPKGAPLSVLHASIRQLRGQELVCDVGALELLLKHGADPNFFDPWSMTLPLEEALSMGDLACVKVLRDMGARTELVSGSGKTFLQSAVDGAVRMNDISVLELALSWGLDPNGLSAAGSDGVQWNALFQAVARPGASDIVPIVIQVVDELIKAGTDPCYVAKDGLGMLDIGRMIMKETPSTAPVFEKLIEATEKCK